MRIGYFGRREVVILMSHNLFWTVNQILVVSLNMWLTTVDKLLNICGARVSVRAHFKLKGYFLQA